MESDDYVKANYFVNYYYISDYSTKKPYFLEESCQNNV